MLFWTSERGTSASIYRTLWSGLFDGRGFDRDYADLYLREHSNSVALHSPHIEAEAIDIRITAGASAAARPITDMLSIVPRNR